MFPNKYTRSSFLIGLAMAGTLAAQTKAGSDTITFVDGEKLIGTLKSATGANVTFMSDMGFVVTVGWAKIKELHSAGQFAAIPKEAPFKTVAEAEKVAQGSVEMKDQTISVTSEKEGTPQTIPVDKIANVVPEPVFKKSLKNRNFFQGWRGMASFGASWTDATVTSKTLNSFVSISRPDHSEHWLDSKNTTNLNFNSFFTYVTQDYVDPTKVNNYILELSQDHMVSKNWFVFAGTSLEHIYGQQLNLSQGYGGGVGMKVINNQKTQLELRAGMGYTHLDYTNLPALSKDLFGSRFGGTFSHTFNDGVSLYVQGGVRPAWSYMKDFFGAVNMGLNFPIYKGFGVDISASEYYNNNPPPYRRPSKIQASVGLSYTLK